MESKSDKIWILRKRRNNCPHKQNNNIHVGKQTWQIIAACAITIHLISSLLPKVCLQFAIGTPWLGIRANVPSVNGLGTECPPFANFSNLCLTAYSSNIRHIMLLLLWDQEIQDTQPPNIPQKKRETVLSMNKWTEVCPWYSPVRQSGNPVGKGSWSVHMAGDFMSTRCALEHVSTFPVLVDHNGGKLQGSVV